MRLTVGQLPIVSAAKMTMENKCRLKKCNSFAMKILKDAKVGQQNK